jgi:hypothetical protein
MLSSSDFHILFLRYDSNQLDKAVTPGPTANTDTHDYMFTTPNRLFAVLDGTIRAFDAMQVRDLEGNPDEDRGLSDRLSLKLYKLCLLSSDRIFFLQDEAGKQMGSNRASTTPLKIKDMRALRDEVVRRYL